MAGAALTVNGSRWRVPLVGGMLDKAFYSPSTLSVEKLGVLYEAHPEITLPEWTTYATLRITADGMGDAAYFDGPVEDYAAFLYPANGEYKAELTVWRLPVGMTDVGFGQPADGAVLPGSGLERPARPAGYYRYAFRFTIQASAELTLSAQRIEQGGVAALEISGMVGSETPTVETDLGSVQCVPQPGGVAVLHPRGLQRLGRQPRHRRHGERRNPAPHPGGDGQVLWRSRGPARPARPPTARPRSFAA